MSTSRFEALLGHDVSDYSFLSLGLPVTSSDLTSSRRRMGGPKPPWAGRAVAVTAA